METLADAFCLFKNGGVSHVPACLSWPQAMTIYSYCITAIRFPGDCELGDSTCCEDGSTRELGEE